MHALAEMPMRRLLLSLSAFVAIDAFAQNGVMPPADASVHTTCAAHADEIFGAIDSADYAAATASFDAALRERYPPEQLKKDVESLPTTYGKTLGRGRPHVGDVGGHTVIMIAVIFEHGTLTAEVHCGGAGAVSDFRLLPTQVMTTP
jgi:hypothetical protein